MFHDSCGLAAKTTTSKAGGTRRGASPRRVRLTDKVKVRLDSGDEGLGPLTAVTAGDRDRVIRDYLEALDSPRALTVWLLYSSGDHRQLVELVCTIDNYVGLDAFNRAYAATKFLSKCVGLKTGIDLKDVAVQSALKAEAQCQTTNQRIRDIRAGRLLPGQQSAVWYRAAAKIANILGPVPHFPRQDCDLPEPSGPWSRLLIMEDVGWSKGRSSSCWGEELSSVHKYSGRPDVTLSARRYARALLQASPRWGQSVLGADGPVSALNRGLDVVEGNTMITVPKSAKTDRVICYEPHMNIRLQLIVGSYMKSRLLRHGVNLSDQSINQARALLSSKTGHLATLDLKSASDTLALELVWELLPFDWACLLDDLRSKYTTWPDGQTRRNEKFSSMGNGFTFELESLIFYAICSSVAEDVTVFGDDIILPADRFHNAVEALEFAGFSINYEKSFCESPFRESCGMDAYRGFQVTPVYLRSLPKRREDIIQLHNAVRRWALQAGPGSNSWRQLLWAWRDVFPGRLGASGFGDGHYHVEFQDACPHKAGYWIEGWWFNSYIRRYEDHTMGNDLPQGVIPAKYGIPALCAATGPKRPIDLWSTGLGRKRFSYKKIRMLVPRWPAEDWI